MTTSVPREKQPPSAAELAAWHERLRAWRGPAELAALDMPAGCRLAVVGPHPDDFDVIAVALRRLLAGGAALHVAVATSGWSGVEDAFAEPPTRRRKGDLREAEQRASADLFGLSPGRLDFLRLREDEAGELADEPDMRRRLDAWLDRVEADVLFLPHGTDSNPTHRRVFAWVRDWMRGSGRTRVALLNRDPKTTAFRTDLYAAFGPDEAAWKGALLRCHVSQHTRNLRTRGIGFDQRILEINRAGARRLGLAEELAAEEFEILLEP